MAVEGRAAAGAMAVEVSVGYVRWAGARVERARCARGRVGWADLRPEREWDGRRGDWRGSGVGGQGIWGLFRRRLRWLNRPQIPIVDHCFDVAELGAGIFLCGFHHGGRPFSGTRNHYL
jgi:hypothetical protein